MHTGQPVEAKWLVVTHSQDLKIVANSLSSGHPYNTISILQHPLRILIRLFINPFGKKHGRKTNPPTSRRLTQPTTRDDLLAVFLLSDCIPLMRELSPPDYPYVSRGKRGDPLRSVFL